MLYIPIDDDESIDDDEELPDAADNEEGVKRFKPDEPSLSEPNQQNNDDNQSTSDDNDSTEAAHAAAIGHSPQPVKPSLTTDSSQYEFDGELLPEKPENVGAHGNGKSENSVLDETKQGTSVEGNAIEKIEKEVLPKLPLQPILESDVDKNPDLGISTEVALEKLNSTNNDGHNHLLGPKDMSAESDKTSLELAK